MTNKEIEESLELLEKIFKLYPIFEDVENNREDKVSFIMETLPTTLEEVWFKTLMKDISLKYGVRIMYTKEWLPSESLKVTFVVKEKK